MRPEPKQQVKRLYYRNQVTAIEEVVVGQRLDGSRRIWHRNGQIASEEFYRGGLLHGLVRQWNSKGRLLGSYRMVHGSGTQRCWHDNGRLNREFSTVSGHFCGRSRSWLRDGTLVSDEILLDGRPVSRAEYQRAMLDEPRLPKLRGRVANLPPKTRSMQRHTLHVFVRGLLAKGNRREGREWLKANGKHACSLGRFRNSRAALKFVEALYQAGAIKVIVPDIYQNQRGDEFAEYLLVRLPKVGNQRSAIRKTCEPLRSRRLGAIEPDQDIGEEYLVVSMA